MSIVRVIHAAIFAALSFTVDATAADRSKPAKKQKPPPVPAEYIEPAYVQQTLPAIWQGFYVGASVGYGSGTSEQTYDRNDNHGLASTSPGGMIGSVTVGYNMMWSPAILLGVEADLGLMNVSADDKVVYDGHVYKTSFGPWWSTVRGRIGYLYGNTLLYGTGGLAMMAVDEVSIGNTPGETATNKDTRAGWVIGAGVEHAITSNMSAKLEYLHMDFGTYEGYSANREDFSFANRLDVVRVGLNMKF